MISTTGKKQSNNNELEIIERNVLPVSGYEFPRLREKLLTNVEQARTVLVHFDHIQGESENDRDQIFSNLLRAAIYFGLNVEKVDFHKQD